MTVPVPDDNSDDDADWEEVYVPPETSLELDLSPPAPRPNIEITLHAPQKKDDAKKKAAAAAQARRVLRTTCHKIHTVALLANARVRNKWANDSLLHARLLSVTPLPLQNGFAMIHKSRVPDQNKRGMLFEAAVDRLVRWWCETYFTVTPTGHIRSRTFEEVEEEVALDRDSDCSESDDDGHERIRSVESLMKHALMRRGSRDASAQLFTALCRALDVPARLVVSLQSVPWKSDGAKGKGRAPQGLADDHEDFETNDQTETQNTAAPLGKDKGKRKEITNPVRKLHTRKSQSTSRSESPAIGARSLKSPDPTIAPPVFWTEVFSRPDLRWLPVDPIRGIVNKRHVFDPTHTQHSAAGKIPVKQDNRMLYVIGIEEDGFGRDITARYARDYTARVSKAQAIGAGPPAARKEWWDSVVRSITRPYRLQRDDLEDDELHMHQLTEGMPSTIAGFKNHPLYALARHLRRDQVIDPPTELGKFRGESVYPRSSVISLKTAENWMRQGRVIRQGSQPMKMVKQRAVTVGRQREMELALERTKTEGHAGGDEVMQGMYALSQTEVFKPEPIKDGKIPKNEFGNIDLYVPSMLPDGAAHIPFKGAAKIAKKLGFDYAEAVTGFEFRKRRALPIIQGVVVVAENENVIVEACLEAEQDAEERARAKRIERACQRWMRLVHGLRIRERLQKQYGSSIAGEKDERGESGTVRPMERRESWLDTDGNEERPGGYLTTADDVVQPFHLPRDMHPHDPASVATTSATRLDDDRSRPFAGLGTDGGATEVEMAEVEESMEADVLPTPRMGVPKSMRELAELDVERERGEDDDDDPTATMQALVEEETTTRKAPGGLRQTKRGPGTKGRRTTGKRPTRKRAKEGDNEDDGSDGDGERGSPAKRRRLVVGEPVTSTGGSVPSVPDPNPGSSRVLRPRREKNEARVREERAMEEAYQRAVGD